MKRYALIMAGGSGLRMSSDIPKQFLLLDGRPILMTTISSFYQYDKDLKIIVVLPKMQIDYWKQLCRKYAFDVPYQIVVGGVERFYSVRNGLEELISLRERSCIEANLQPSSWDLVAIHDAVRPLVGTDLIKRCFHEAEKYGAIIPVMPLNESIRRMLPSGKSKAEDRAQFCNVQTPQVFRLDDLWTAYQQPYRKDFTDDASVMESAGYTIHLISGHQRNIKITTPEDMLLAEFWIKQS